MMALHDYLERPISIRAYAPAYSSAALFSGFLSIALFSFGFTVISAMAVLIALVLIPVLAATDRIVFDGKRLYRRGLFPYLWARLNHFKPTIKLGHIEQVETALRWSFKRGSTVHYAFRTVVIGNGQILTFAGGGSRYRRFARTLLPHVSEELLDIRSLEIKRYLVERREALRRARLLRIPSADALDGVFRRANGTRFGRRSDRLQPTSDDAGPLRTAANQLRMNGSLVRAAEAFRRALLLRPTDAWLLFECSRSINALAYAERSDTLALRSMALLRLAEKRAGSDGELLERIGETYIQFGASRRALPAFQHAIERLGERFRSLVGLAEVALEQGKLAHVVHNFAAVVRIEKSYSLRRWAKAEADYFSRLNDDEEYMSLEAGRLDLLERLARWKNFAFRIAFYSMSLIVFGTLIGEPLVANTGWLVSTIGFFLWIVISGSMRLFSSRIPLNLVSRDR